MDFTHGKHSHLLPAWLVKAVDIMLKMRIVADQRAISLILKESYSSAASALTKNVEIDALNRPVRFIFVCFCFLFRFQHSKDGWSCFGVFLQVQLASVHICPQIQYFFFPPAVKNKYFSKTMLCVTALNPGYATEHTLPGQNKTTKTGHTL